MNLGVVILAAGQGTRMRSAVPKVLHPLAGKALLAHVLDTSARLNPSVTTVVYGHGGEQVLQKLADRPVRWVEQARQLGTGHAVQQALDSVQAVDKVLVLYGDVPLTALATLQQLLEVSRDTPLGVLTVTLNDPSGYGRIVRDEQQRITHIVEQKDASPEQLAIAEINTGIMVFDRARLSDWLGRVNNRNAQGEYYLTDVIELAVKEGVAVASAQPGVEEEVMGINDRQQLAGLERYFQNQQARDLMAQGVSFADPARFDLRGELSTGQDVFIDVNTIIQGKVTLGEGVAIGPNCLLRDCTIGAGTQIHANSVIEEAKVGEGALIGPFARLRPGADLADQVHVGNFVEIKKSTVGLGSKVNHLTYVGDSRIGKGVNVGAGTITCNYDGANKHQTVIGDDTFIGSNAALVAPVTIGNGATVGAGSVITRDVDPGSLSVSRGRQTQINGWERPSKKK